MFAIDSIRDRHELFQCNSFYVRFANFLSTSKENCPRVLVYVQVSMLDDSLCCLRSLIFGAKIRIDFHKVQCLKAYQVLWFDGGATHAH